MLYRQAVEGLIETALAVIDRLVVDKAPVEGENQPLHVAANGRADGVPIVGVGIRGVYTRDRCS